MSRSLEYVDEEAGERSKKRPKTTHSKYMNLVCNQGMRVLFGSFFMFSNLYLLYLHNKTCVTFSKHQQKLIENQTLHDLVMVIRSACLLIP